MKTKEWSSRARRAPQMAALAFALGLSAAATLAAPRAEAAPVLLLEPDLSGPAGLLAPIDVNAAGEEQLMLLPGIGPTKAKAIVAYRVKRRFRAVNDLLRVKGIGRETLKRIRPFVTVDGGGSEAPAPGPAAGAR